jgi:predicted transcriptional regulator
MKPGRSKSVRHAEAIVRDRAAETWQLDEVHSALTELNEVRNVPHQTVVKWLRSWGKRPERKAPRA